MAASAATRAVDGLTALAAGCCLVGVAVPPALAQADDSLSFAVENYTSVNLVEFYVTPSSGQNWGGNQLDSAIPPRAAGQVAVDDGLDDCLYDVLGVFDDGEYAEEYGVDLCEIDGGSYAFYGGEDVVFVIENQSDDAIVEFYFTPETAEDWGENLFATATPPFVLQPGAAVDIPVDSADCTYDVVAVFADGDRLEQDGVDVCEPGASIVFTDVP